MFLEGAMLLFTDSHLTEELNEWVKKTGDSEPSFEVIYCHLKRLAKKALQPENHSIEAMDLAHETFLQLTMQKVPKWKNRQQFFAVTAMLMRRLLVDHVRRKNCRKRGQDWQHTTFDEENGYAKKQILAVDDLLESLDRFDKKLALIVKLKFFVGLSHVDISQVLGVSERTIKKEWRIAKAWLKPKIQEWGLEQRPDI